MDKKSSKSRNRVPLYKEDGQLEKLEENRVYNNVNNDGLDSDGHEDEGCDGDGDVDGDDSYDDDGV